MECYCHQVEELVCLANLQEDHSLLTFYSQTTIIKLFLKQECILVGCVPPACCAYLPACTPGRGLTGFFLGRGLPGFFLGASAPGRGRLLPGGIPACTEAGTPVDRITDTCKKHNLVPTSLRAVTSRSECSSCNVSHWLQISRRRKARDVIHEDSRHVSKRCVTSLE